MNKLPAIIFIFSVVVLSSAFSMREPSGNALCKDSLDVNPNGSSELSLLMRKMYDHAAEVRKGALEKKVQQDFPNEFLSIYTAKPTDVLTKNASFDPFADGYLYALNNYRSSTGDNVVLNYNNLVTSCINCHTQHCPGPISKIKKLLITEPVK